MPGAYYYSAGWGKWLMSFLIPVDIASFTSKLSGKIDLTLINGRLIMDSQSSNYSYGSLQKALYTGLRQIPHHPVPDHILLLGLGGGSVIESIRKRLGWHSQIQAVDIDPVMIGIAGNYYGMSKDQRLELIEADAAHFIHHNSKTFDLIIIDLFIQQTTPVVFTETLFILDLVRSLRPGGHLLFNTMRTTLRPEHLNRMRLTLHEAGLTLNILSGIEDYNDLIIACKH